MNRDVCEHFNPVGMCDVCRQLKLCQLHLMHYGGIMCTICEDENAKTKKAMMKRMRNERKRQGFVRLELWLTTEQKERVLRYLTVEKLK